jgi:hypothetical protein
VASQFDGEGDRVCVVLARMIQPFEFQGIEKSCSRGDGERFARDRACGARVRRLSDWKIEASTISASGSDSS